MSYLKIDYKSDLHKKTRDAILARYKFSKREMGKRYGQWKKNEEKFLAYIPETDNNRLRRLKREDGEPQYTTIEIPYSYATALTAHTYWTSVFLARSPIFQFSARHGEPQQRVESIEAIIDYQVNVGQMLVPLYVWLLDPAKYGFGVLGMYWDEERSVVSEIVEEDEKYLGMIPTGKKVKKRITKETTGYVGNKLYNVRPQDFFPDPRMPLSQLQQGEFVGRYVEVGWNTVVKRQQNGVYFNLDALKQHRMRIKSREQGSTQITLPDAKQEIDIAQFADNKDMGYVSLLEMYVELVPSEWGLGSTDYPEKWVFVLAEEEVIVHASPMGLWHNRFPFAIQEYEPDGYSLFSRAFVEVISPMQDILTWLVNSHLQNVRKSLNDMFVFDPSRVVMKDVMDPRPGKFIRLKPEAYGTPINSVIQQLQVQDVTRGHMTDAAMFTDLIQRVTGVTDNIMGMVNASGRKTATEVRTSTSFGTNRLKTNAEYMSAMGWAPLAQMLVQTTQQKFDITRQFRVAGDLMRNGGTFREITPEAVQGFFDFIPVDGTLPVDKFALANLWKELTGMIISSPLAQSYNIDALFAYTARLGGAKNVEQFKIKAVPDDQLDKARAAGNVVPIMPTGSSSAAMGRPNQPQQMPGMGNLA